MAQALKLEGIHKKFGDFVALKSIDLTIESGELVVEVPHPASRRPTTMRRPAKPNDAFRRYGPIRSNRDQGRC